MIKMKTKEEHETSGAELVSWKNKSESLLDDDALASSIAR